MSKIKGEEVEQLRLNSLQANLRIDRDTFSSNIPFPHICFDNFLAEEVARKIHDEFPITGEGQWIQYFHYNERKSGLNNQSLLPKPVKNLIDQLHSYEFCNYLSQLSGIKNLIPDHTLEGGGLHSSERGGYLNIHADFTVHPHNPTWERRLNLLIYFNQDWKKEFGGDLEFWSNDMKKCIKQIEPIFNRCAIFATKADSYHGFPEPLKCPEGERRLSLALYYYTQSDQKVKIKPTNYKSRPEDGLKSILIWLDKKVVSIYTLVKKRFGLNDDMASLFLGFFRRKKR
ncbi:2OG-Fe(II) oxygenase [Roseivirga pacifica]|uniref:2OG-Fe(II) oxygenase n=1 Tax=Roseivirga pacifica TaxID=1267423 RepID=UPI0020949933|nr:2OG-Fe(II) oxygenase [Roseivirga pacifica]MCO6359827.1 2OG-Fe(II) oxygenase [Roseivirga pacifica]MCO6367197.1 2OG-Fe(II) oxygenase [Roseivirga pacifica]MCO6370271.1 2OG-Fe(II) oxygenase [Roseivirga pacifica]MCO6374854.1 2OG-Fe(II) oxygenase [Roseivirga pacifica]MCO6380112.1 2OG-Fe(II) oxygenase [Roseivirga pacifica]